MELEELKLEKEKIVDLQNKYIDKLINKIDKYEKEIKNYKLKLEGLESKVRELTLEISLKDIEVVDNKRKIDQLRSELTKAEDEIYNLRAINPHVKLELIKDLKEAYIESNHNEVEEILDLILEELKVIQDKISDDDIMVIMYLSYIYDRLDKILSISSVAKNYYSSINREAKLLNILSEEENCKLYTIKDECVQSYISKEKDLFNKLDVKIRSKIIETLYDMSYKIFDGAYKESDIDLGDITVNIKAWVKEENNLSWKLINAKYSSEKDCIYLPKDIISVLGLKLNESQNNKSIGSFDLKVREIKEMFLSEEYKVLIAYMEYVCGDNYKNKFVELASYNISPSTITINDAYNLLLISAFCNMQNILINESPYLKSIYYGEELESKLIRGIVNELSIKVGGKIDLPITIFLMGHKDKIVNIQEDIKKKAFKLINLYFYKKFDKIYVFNNNNLNNCKYDNKYLQTKKGFIEVSNSNGDKKYYLLKDKYCNDCNTVYIKFNKYNKINEELNTYKLSQTKIKIEKNNKIVQKSNKYEILYNSLLDYFSDNNLEMSLLTFKNIIEDVNALKYYNRMQKITALFIGYLINKSTFGSTKIMNSGEIGISTDTILYKKLSEDRNYIEYLTEHRDSLNLIDSKVKGDIIVKMIALSKEDSSKYKSAITTNQDVYDGSNLNAESEIKKMGYSTSLTREERWNILKNRAIPKLGKTKVIGHISFLIKMNKGRSVMFNAVNEWMYDLDRLSKL